jgi:glycosyltransferase involved in cell wall biosynthesis
LLLNILVWLIRNSTRHDLIILHPDALLITPVLRLFGRSNIHLDIRTVPVEINSFKKKLDRWLFWTVPMASLMKMAQGYSFITDRLRKTIEKEFDTTFESYVLWTSGVNTDRFTPGRQAIKVGDEWILFYHGTISEKRGIATVIRAMVDIQNDFQGRIRFVLFGGGPDLTALRKLSSELGLSEIVRFEGMHPYETIPDKLAQADICICPLPDRPEWNISSPIKVFEYMASGKPMILTPIASHMDVAEDMDFVVWTEGDRLEHFQRAIRHAFQNLDKLRESAKQAPEIAKRNFEWSIQGQRLAEYLEKSFPKWHAATRAGQT